ncbi:MAG: UvrABC system protein C, partial [Alphaproteobacteria bacterium MarineAlpha3_Bin4]
GGRGHLGVALEVFEDLGLDDIAIAAIAKGPERNAGRERIFVAGRSNPVKLEPRDPLFYFLQRLRDEAHRYANSAHRQKRSRALSRSILDDIPGVGARRKKALLHHFGGPNAVSQAGRADLEAVDGISKTLAGKIYDWFYPDG